jgi:beta-N-acetylhexosaminidase
MIGQMLMMGFPGSNPDGSWPKRLAAQISRGQVGGVVMLGYNFKSKASVKRLTAMFRQAAGRRKLFIALDMEGGAVQRLGRKLGYPAIHSARRIAKTQTPQQAQRTYSRLASISRSAGFNMNLGPVVDLLINPSNPVIGRWNRSYGSDPARVVAYASAFVKAHRAQGIVTVLKHFPGHGSSLSDSHDGFVDISSTWRNKELEPFAKMIAKGDAVAIMPGHLIHRKIAGSVPVSISRKAIKGLLRNKLKFRGLVLSDDLQMGAIAKNFSYRSAVIRAVNAGVDMLMISNSRKPDKNLPAKTIAIISNAIDKGQISEATVRAAYKRIQRAKAIAF